MNLPNKLTVFRIILVPIMVIIPFFNISGSFLNIPTSMWIMNLIFIIASITDKLDGSIARATNQITVFGKFLDPIADKILVLSAMLILVEMDKLPAWIPIIVLFREFVVSGYRLVEVETQMIAIILAFADVGSYFGFINGNISGIAYWINAIGSIFMTISVIATIFSGWDYIKNGKDLLKS